MTVERLEREMSSEEFEQWIEFYELEPFGNEEKMNDMRHASLCSLSVSIAGSDSSPNDFMMYREIKEKTASKIDFDDMSDEQIKQAQSAVILIMTTK